MTFPYSWQEILSGRGISKITQRLLSRSLQLALLQMPTFLPSPGGEQLFSLESIKHEPSIIPLVLQILEEMSRLSELLYLKKYL